MLIYFENFCLEYFQNYNDNKNLELDDENDSIPELDIVSSMPYLIDYDYEAE